MRLKHCEGVTVDHQVYRTNDLQLTAERLNGALAERCWFSSLWRSFFSHKLLPRLTDPHVWLGQIHPSWLKPSWICVSKFRGCLLRGTGPCRLRGGRSSRHTPFPPRGTCRLATVTMRSTAVVYLMSAVKTSNMFLHERIKMSKWFKWAAVTLLPTHWLITCFSGICFLLVWKLVTFQFAGCSRLWWWLSKMRWSYRPFNLASGVNVTLVFKCLCVLTKTPAVIMSGT